MTVALRVLVVLGVAFVTYQLVNLVELLWSRHQHPSQEKVEEDETEGV